MRAWIAKDKDGSVYLYTDKPEKGYDLWFSSFTYIGDIEIPEDINPEWEDDEPIEVELKIKKV